MDLFRNYYELPGSDLKIHELMETLSQLKDMGKKGVLKPEIFKELVETLIRKTVNEQLKEAF